MAFINLSQLTKAVKGLVNKINLENYIISSKLGNLSNLDTSDKSNLVAAINEVMDNSTTNYTQLTNKPSINNVTLSGNKTASDLGLAPAGAYVKPSNGIPKTDLASGVQASLDLADTALQSYTETDPTVPAWAKAATKPTYTASEVGALPSSTVIPSKTSDLTNDSGFVNATGAASAAPVQSVNGQTGTVTISALPTVTASDNGKVLMVVNGVWTAVNLPNASGVSF